MLTRHAACGLSEIPLIRAMRATLLIRNDLIENHDALYNSMIAIAIYKIRPKLTKNELLLMNCN